MVWIELLVLALALYSVVVAVMANGAMAAVSRSAARMRHVATRRAMLAEEGLRYAESKRTVVLATQTAETAVEAITQVTQTGHSVIAATTFTALEQFPLTKDVSKAMRGVHDSIVDGVYDSITAINKGIGSAIRRGAGAVPTSGAGSGPAIGAGRVSLPEPGAGPALPASGPAALPAEPDDTSPD